MSVSRDVQSIRYRLHPPQRWRKKQSWLSVVMECIRDYSETNGTTARRVWLPYDLYFRLLGETDTEETPVYSIDRVGDCHVGLYVPVEYPDDRNPQIIIDDSTKIPLA